MPTFDISNAYLRVLANQNMVQQQCRQAEGPGQAVEVPAPAEIAAPFSPAGRTLLPQVLNRTRPAKGSRGDRPKGRLSKGSPCNRETSHKRSLGQRN
jgi:hypothetical protein